jgi:hypothetical protein
MNDHHPPALDSPYGPGTWRQPDRTQVLIDPTHALMTKAVFESLAEYSTTMPSGVYPGKMWRRHDGAHDPRCTKPEWLFCWYGPTPDPDQCSVNSRKVIFL